MPAAVATHYARALAGVITKPGSQVDPRQASAELDAFAGALAASSDLRHVLLSPAVPPARKRAVVADLARMLSISSVVMRFLFVLIDHRRAALLADIREAFEAVIDERLGVVRVDVASARELTQAQRDALTAELSRLTGKRARSQFSIQPGLIGGVVARVGSTVYDGSVRAQLEGLRQKLASAGS